jgi:hypothetical protein
MASLVLTALLCSQVNLINQLPVDELLGKCTIGPPALTRVCVLCLQVEAMVNQMQNELGKPTTGPPVAVRIRALPEAATPAAAAASGGRLVAVRLLPDTFGGVMSGVLGDARDALRELKELQATTAKDYDALLKCLRPPPPPLGSPAVGPCHISI